MPTLFLKKLSKSEDKLKPIDTTMTDLIGNNQQARNILTTKLTVGSKILRRVRTAFFVVDADSHYNLLLGHDQIHANECVPSTLHEKLFQWVGDRVKEIMVEGRPQTVDINVEGAGHINQADTDPFICSSSGYRRSTTGAPKGSVGGYRRATRLVEMKRQKLGAEALDELWHNKPTEVGFSIELVKLANERSCIKILILEADLNKNDSARVEKTVTLPNDNSAKIHEGIKTMHGRIANQG